MVSYKVNYYIGQTFGEAYVTNTFTSALNGFNTFVTTVPAIFLGVSTSVMLIRYVFDNYQRSKR